MLRGGFRSITSWLAVVVLALGFFSNQWRVVDAWQFEHFQEDSDALVLGALAHCAKSGISRHGLWAASDRDVRFDDPEWVATTRGAWLNGGTPKTWWPYTSQVGIQGWMYCGIRTVLGGLDPVRFVLAMEALNSVLLAFFVALIVLWTRSLGPDVGMVIPTILIVFSPWLTQIGSSVYWAPWTWFLPMAVAIRATRAGTVTASQSRFLGMLLLVALSVFVKSAAGYEFISYVLVAMMLPFLAAYLRAKRGGRSFGRGLLAPAAAGLIGFCAAIVLHAYLRSEGRGIGAGLSRIFADAVRRTSSELGDIDALPGILRESLLVPVTQVLGTYLSMPIVTVGSFPGFAAQSFLLAIGVCWALLGIRQLRPQGRDGVTASRVALGVVAIGAAIAPLSWFALAKGHSYIHDSINPALWTLPMVPLAVVFGASMLSDIVGARSRAPFTWVTVAVFAFALVASLSSDLALLRRSQAGIHVHHQPSGARFSVFRAGRDVVFVSWSPVILDPDTRFFVHVYPDRVERLPVQRRQHGFDNLDFDFRFPHQLMPPWSVHRGAVIFKRRIPSTYEPRRIAVGQFRPDTGAQLWSGELSD